MAVVTAASSLKAAFVSGARPAESDFVNLIDTIYDAGVHTLTINVSGATAASLQDRLTDFVINAKRDFKAKGDGSTIDTTAIRNAIDAADELDVPCYFPPGTYMIDDRLSYNCPLWGADPSKTIIKADTTFLAEKSVTFAGTSIDVSADSILASAHALVTADPVIFSVGGGDVPSPLDDGFVYFAIPVDANNFSLATSAAGTAINLTTQGSGASMTVTRKLMMLDFNGTPRATNRSYIKNFIFDCNDRPGVRGWSSTSPTGSGTASGGRSTIDNVEITDCDHTVYALDAETTTGSVSEGGMLTGAVLNNFSTRRCELAMILGSNIDDTTFNSPRFHADGNNQGSESKPFMDIGAQNVTFNSVFCGAIGPIGYSFAGPFTVKPLILLRSAENSIVFNSMFVETTKGTTDMTHIFIAENNFNLTVNNILINVDDPSNTARGILFNVLRATTSARSSFHIQNVVSDNTNLNPFKRLIETDRVGSPASGTDDQGVSVYFSGLESGQLHNWPFTMLNNTAGTQENRFWLDLHGTFKRRRYDHGMNEGDAITQRGQRLYEASFDPTDVDTAADSITVSAHEFLTGDIAWFEAQDGSAAPGLTDETLYFAVKVDDNTVQLADESSAAFAGNVVNITAVGSGAGQTLTRMHKLEALHYDQPFFTDFIGSAATATDDQIVRVPGAGTYWMHARAKRNAGNSNLAESTYLVYYSNETNPLAVTSRIGATAANGAANDLVVQSGPDAQGDITLRFTYTGGPFANQWQVTFTRLDTNN